MPRSRRRPVARVERWARTRRFQGRPRLALRALLELKLAKSSSLRRNLNNQTGVYASAEGCDRGYFVIIQFRDEDCDAAFISTIEAMAAQVAATKEILFEVVFVDARPKASASTV